MLLSHPTQHATGAGNVHVVYALVPAVPPAAPPEKRFIPFCPFHPAVHETSIYQVPVHERVSVQLIYSLKPFVFNIHQSDNVTSLYCLSDVIVTVPETVIFPSEPLPY